MIDGLLVGYDCRPLALGCSVPGPFFRRGVHARPGCRCAAEDQECGDWESQPKARRRPWLGSCGMVSVACSARARLAYRSVLTVFIFAKSLVKLLGSPANPSAIRTDAAAILGSLAIGAGFRLSVYIKGSALRIPGGNSKTTHTQPTTRRSLVFLRRKLTSPCSLHCVLQTYDTTSSCLRLSYARSRRFTSA
jgi:hypothetical protein